MADRQVCYGPTISTAHGSLGGGVDVLKEGEKWKGEERERMAKEVCARIDGKGGGEGGKERELGQVLYCYPLKDLCAGKDHARRRRIRENGTLTSIIRNCS